MNWIKDIFAGIMTPVTAYVKGRETRKLEEIKNSEKVNDREHEARMKKIDVAHELAKQGQKIEADWDTNAQNNMKYTWKDEWFVILFSIPLIGAFIPFLSGDILAGFNVLSKTPEWYRWLLAGIVVATFGLRWMFSKLKV